MMTTKTTIMIYRDDVYAGEGYIDSTGEIVCSAVLGPDQDASDETYEAIMDEIDSEPQDAERYTGTGSIERPDGVYSWSITAGESTVCGNVVQWDKSGGQGHCWRTIDRNDISADILDELEGEMIDGGKETCESFRASDGQYYRW
jgi:hypothetical protein